MFLSCPTHYITYISTFSLNNTPPSLRWYWFDKLRIEFYLKAQGLKKVDDEYNMVIERLNKVR